MLLLSGIAAAVLLYTYLGYPAIIWVLGAIRRREPACDSAHLPQVSVLLPVFNGAPHLQAKLDSLLAQDYPEGRFDIWVYDDGSTDETRAIAQACARRDGRVHVVAADERSGKPRGLNSLAARAGGEVLVLTDVRPTLATDALRALATRLVDPAVGAVTGQLEATGDAGAGLYWRYEQAIRRSESRFRGMVGVTGPLYAVRRSEMPVIDEDIVLDDVWIPMRRVRAGQRVHLVADAVARTPAFDDGQELRRKIRTLAGNYQVLRRLPWLLIPFGNPLWFETVSHKVARLASPWMLLALLAATIVGTCQEPDSVWFVGLAGSQAAVYGAASLGPLLGRAGRVCRTFVMLNAAAASALFVRPKVRWRIAAEPAERG